ncbi:MAG: hypothetical protein LUD69_00030, partial [Oscillospiraceae bacterium]|nr:hypothetical protein [Oscillospiraceae bacterium]
MAAILPKAYPALGYALRAFARASGTEQEKRTEIMTFEQLGLMPQICAALGEKVYQTPTPI